jgi:hypothetical protein
LRDFQSFRFEDLTKPLPDLVANRATMDVVELESFSVAVRHVCLNRSDCSSVIKYA